MPMKIYANTPQVSLIVNGKKLGDSPVRNNFAFFLVPLRSGRNSLIASGGDATDVFNIDVDIVPDHFTSENTDGVELAVNAGSNCDYISSASGMTWVADREYASGSWGRIGGKRKKVTSEIHGTDDIPLFQPMAEGLEGYRFDVPDGEYEIELGFADPSGNSEGIAYMLGKDKQSVDNCSSFSIKMNDALLEENFTPAAAHGNKFALRKKYIASAKSGSLILSFIPVKGNTNLNSIKIRKL